MNYLYEENWAAFESLGRRMPFVLGFDFRDNRHDWIDAPGRVLVADETATATSVLTRWIEEASDAIESVVAHWPEAALKYIRDTLKDPTAPALPCSDGRSQQCLRANAMVKNLLHGRWADDAAIHEAPDPVDLSDRDLVLTRQVELAGALSAARIETGRAPKGGATLIGPSINPLLASKLSTALRKAGGPESLADGLLQGNSFLFYVKSGEFEPTSALAFCEAILGERASERDFYDAVSWVVASGSYEPVFRSAHLPSRLYEKLDHLGNMTWTQRTIRRSVNRWERYGKDLSQAVGEPLLRELATMRHVRFLSDLPLEWCRIDGVPLSYLVPTSRIPLAPGNLPVRLLVDVRPLVVWRRQNDVPMLFLNGHAADDPLRGTAAALADIATKLGFDAAVDTLQRGSDLPRLLRRHQPQFLYISAHGGVTKDLGTTLALPDGNSSLRYETIGDVPAVAILSACRSDGVARTHGGPASNLYTAGVRAVLASYLPLTEPHASMVMSGLLVNLRAALRGEPPHCTNWLELVWTTLNMRRPIDILAAASRWSRRNDTIGKDPMELFAPYTLVHNKENESLQDLWTRTPTRLVDLARGTEFETSIRAVTRDNSFRSESCFYTNIGEPECVRFVPE